MIMQIFLICGLLALGIFAASQRRRAGLVSFVMIALAVGGIFLVALPDATTDLANALGVGRGADLVSYIFILFSLSAILNLHLRLRAEAEVVTRLARAIAIESAEGPTESKQK